MAVLTNILTYIETANHIDCSTFISWTQRPLNTRWSLLRQILMGHILLFLLWHGYWESWSMLVSFEDRARHVGAKLWLHSHGLIFFRFLRKLTCFVIDLRVVAWIFRIVGPFKFGRSDESTGGNRTIWVERRLWTQDRYHSSIFRFINSLTFIWKLGLEPKFVRLLGRCELMLFLNYRHLRSIVRLCNRIGYTRDLRHQVGGIILLVWFNHDALLISKRIGLVQNFAVFIPIKFCAEPFVVLVFYSFEFDVIFVSQIFYHVDVNITRREWKNRSDQIHRSPVFLEIPFGHLKKRIWIN